jgi:hypothetical protein
MHFLDSFDSLKLDVVGIIAVLGEASVTRNAQVSALSWYRFALLIPDLIVIPDVKDTQCNPEASTSTPSTAGA